MPLKLEDFPRTPQDVLDRLYEQVALIDKVCEAHSIKYWLIGGSLLGLERGGEIVPWDDDADVGIFVEDQNKLMKHLSWAAKAEEMVVWRTEYGLKLKCLKRKGVGTDVFTYTKVAENESDKGDANRFVLSPKARNTWKRDWFHTDELAVLQLRKLGEITVWAPNNPQRYLKTLYGNDCMIVGKLDFSHLGNRKHENAGIKVSLEESDFPKME